MTTLNFRTDMKLATQTLAAVDEAISKAAEDGFREHLGASLIGGSCNRKLWYSFHWATKVTHDPRVLRLFQRGHDEEARITKLLRDAGIKVMTVDPSTGEQFRFKDGHFGGSMDGACVQVPEAYKTWHVLEYKTHGIKSYNKLESEGVQKSKPEHYAQMQVYMLKMELTRALYVAVCKDDDRMHMERIDIDKEFAQSMVDKAQWIISLPTPPDGVSTDASWFECKFCDHQATCHKDTAPVPTCRSCSHSTATRDGEWMCEKGLGIALTAQDQKEACTDHVYIPILLKNWAEPVDASACHVEYKTEHGTIINGSGGFSSQEIYACKNKTVLTNETALEYRKQFNGRIVG